MGEAAAVHADDNGNFPPIPKEFIPHERADKNRRYLMRPTTQKVNSRDVIKKEHEGKEYVVTFHPNCNSKYTQPKTVKYREKGKSYPDFEYDEKEVHLCERHSGIFGE